MNLEQYVKKKYGAVKPYWFIEEVGLMQNAERVRTVKDIKDYLSGEHNIKNRPKFVYNGEIIEPRRIVINMAKTIISFKSQYLLKNPVTMIGEESMVSKLNHASKLSRYDDKNNKIMTQLVQYGQVAEYVFIDNKGRINSKIIDSENGTPIWNQNNELIGFIESYIFDGITYWYVYDDKTVTEYTNEGGEPHYIGTYISLSGLPIVYKTTDVLDDTSGRSELLDWIPILDNMEDTISKYSDAFYKFMNPIPVVTGQQLRDAIPQEVVGGGINLDDGADFKFESTNLDYNSFRELYGKLNQTLLDVSNTPAVSMNKTDISNLSEVSIKMLFQMADTSAGEYETYMRNGMYQRYEKMARLMRYVGEGSISDDELISLEFKFQYNTPSNNKEVMENLKVQHEMGAISRETIIEQSPYVSDVPLELERLAREGQNSKVEDFSKVSGRVSVSEEETL
ncbi:phage portal protein [Lysinibacillus sp. GbtcB16]|uniref:phage portal protein n=1 Tax=Lysinibacillus sp. GbtcB16 TaxID=2824761 RepID=UPI001C2F3CA5|nr:phage portal protein [Lysinibacillus sp. GbtcB16]